MLFINHSREPNVGFAGDTVLVAMRDISPGEELTTDYALIHHYDGMMQCRVRNAGTGSGQLARQPNPPPLSQDSPAHG